VVARGALGAKLPTGRTQRRMFNSQNTMAQGTAFQRGYFFGSRSLLFDSSIPGRLVLSQDLRTESNEGRELCSILRIPRGQPRHQAEPPRLTESVKGASRRGARETRTRGEALPPPRDRGRGRCRSGATCPLGDRVPGCVGGCGREGRQPREPDARAWCRWRRGQSRHPTLIFDLATGRCLAARCPCGPSASWSSGVSRSGARGDELLSAPPGSPVLLLLPPPLLLPPSLRQSSEGSWSRQPRPTAEGGTGHDPTHTHAHAHAHTHTHTRRQGRAPAAV
jgi:hypothetical protein